MAISEIHLGGILCQLIVEDSQICYRLSKVCMSYAVRIFVESCISLHL